MKVSRALAIAAASVSWAALATPASAQDAGDTYVSVAAARTKLADKGEVATNGVVNPADGYKTRETWHGIVTAGHFVIDGVAVEASVSTPATTNNVPAGALAGLPNLGDDEFVLLTFGGRYQPLKGPLSPYVGGGIQWQVTTQERDGLGVNLNIPNANGPYVKGGVEMKITPNWGVFVEARKAWYHTNASGLLPLDATFTTFAQVDAKAVLNPFTVSAGVTAHFGNEGDEGAPAIGPGNHRWVLKAGLTSLSLADKLDLDVGGAPFPGAALSTFEHATPTLQAGYFFTPNIAANLTVGIPPKIDVFGGGTIGPVGKLGEVRYGPMALTAQYHFTREGRIRPYVGAGASYMIVFNAKDGAFGDLKVDNDLGWAFEAGTDLMVSNDMGLFIDVKKALLRPRTTGTFAGNDVVGKTKLDPWAFSGGVSFHF